MEALHSCLTTGEQSGGQEYCQTESPHRGPQPKSPSQPRQKQQTCSPKPHGTPKKSRRQHPERKRLRHQRQSIDSDTALEHKHETTTATKAITVSSGSSGVPLSTEGVPTQSKPETQEGTLKQKRECKPQRPGKYVCTYCGRACAKPSVLQKHIRSHTGERPYPCAPCGFSFKTKSNLYKHRKSHTHRVKAGLALGEPRSFEEQITESEDETKQLSSASSHTERQGSVASIKTYVTDKAKDCTGGNTDSYAVKKRLALRLSRGKHGSQDLPDEKTSSLILGSRGSTESGYFSRSESTEQSQDSPPNTSAKSYAEIILGKYGRLGHLQRMSRHKNQQPSGQEDKSIPFTVPKKQVIDHITNLITINEAVVDTSKIDSVKPRRFSLSRKNSSESQKSSAIKDPLIHSPKAGDLAYKNSGSITMGVPCKKCHPPSLNVEQPAGQTSIAPLLRSHSMPSAASSLDASSGGPSKFRLSQSFDERQPSEMQASRRYGMLRRQPAFEIPLGAELTKEEHEGSHLFYPDNITTVPDQKQSQPQPYECEACGTGCNDWEGYKKHRQGLCLANHPRSEVLIGQMGCSPLISHAVRAGASAMRKRRKEESFEFDEPASPLLTSPALLSGQSQNDSNVAYEGPSRPTLQTCSVIQHTSSFEKQDSLCNENQGTEAIKNSPLHEDYQIVPEKPQQQSTKFASRKLVRQHSVQVPEILVTEDSNMSIEASMEPPSAAKQSEKPDEFQWPQRSPSLAQLPIEKLPPKKKRLRLSEAAQSSGESSFDSISLPRSPGQDSSASYASSRSTSFEESNKINMGIASSTPLRRSRASHMLTVPGVHQHREMRRSASEQAPHDTQSYVPMAETRSKSFDFSCLSPERSAVGWRERRKCLLMRHTAIRDPGEEVEENCTIPSCSPEYVSPSTPSQANPTSIYYSMSSASPLLGETVLHNPVRFPCKEIFCQWKLSENIQLTGSTELSLTHCTSVDPVKEEASHILTGQPSPQAPQLYPTLGPSGAARARYLPMSRGLKLEIPSLHDDHSDVRVSPQQPQHPHITSSLELLRPVTSQSVAVRHQTDTLTLACAIYTTLSLSTSPTPKERVGVVSHNLGIPTAEYRDHRNPNPDLQMWSDDRLRIPGSGGNKRVLSPSTSIESPPESQQQQKRVKEEDTKVGCVDKLPVDTPNQELNEENQSCVPSVCSPITHVKPSIPSLQSSTCNSWCYLNYVKPNPSSLDQHKPSVYSSWSTSSYDPNPPGLSSKTALSLLHCKQRLSPSIYTTSPMSVRTTESMEKEDNKKPFPPEVHSSQSYCRAEEGTRKEQQSAADDESHRKEEIEEDEKKEVPQPPEVWTSERGSNEKHAIMPAGDGGKCPCEDRLNNASVHNTESPPGDSKHCNVYFKAKGVCEEHSIQPDKEKDGGYPDLGQGGHDEEDNTKDKAGRREEDSRSVVAESSHTASSEGEKSHPGGPSTEPESSQSFPLPPKDSTTNQSPASARRALFAHRRLNALASVASSGGSHSPSAQSLIPPGEPSTPHAPPSSLSLSSCPVSSTVLSPADFPVPGISPVILQSLQEDTSAKSRLHLTDQQSTARRSVDEVGPTHITALPNRTLPRGAQNLLSHLPLHSQQPSKAPSLLIPIGGIHMVQPRSPLPMYSLVSSPSAANPTAANRTVGTGTSWRLSEPPKERFYLLDTFKATSPRSQSDAPLQTQSQGCFTIQQLPGADDQAP